jgi:murein DD-endopeptidase MepM/ murein hydrolase activator NlpD
VDGDYLSGLLDEVADQWRQMDLFRQSSSAPMRLGGGWLDYLTQMYSPASGPSLLSLTANAYDPQALRRIKESLQAEPSTTEKVAQEFAKGLATGFGIPLPQLQGIVGSKKDNQQQQTATPTPTPGATATPTPTPTATPTSTPLALPGATPTPTPTPTQVPQGTGVMRWRPLVEQYAKQQNVPLALALAIMQRESSGDPEAVSPQGAQGLMQVMPFHFQGLTPEQMREPERNVAKGVEILANNYKRWNDWQKAVAAYFGAIDQAGNITGAQDAWGTTGNAYVQGVMDAMRDIERQLGTGAYRYPLDGNPYLTQGFGATDFAKSSGWYKTGEHPGVDWSVPVGTSVYAATPGEVLQAAMDNAWGNTVLVKTPDGYQVRYAHLSDLDVNPGDILTAGQLLGLSGDTGLSTNPHLHFGVQDPSGSWIDPLAWLATVMGAQ